MSSLINVFSYLEPDPLENYCTRALAFLIHPERKHGSHVLRNLLQNLPSLRKWYDEPYNIATFDYESYSVETQERISSERDTRIFDTIIKSPLTHPKIVIRIENKVDSDVDEKQIRRYAADLGPKALVTKYLVLNTKDSIPELTNLPRSSYFTLVRWHEIARVLEGYTRENSNDIYVEDFKVFLVENGMGSLDEWRLDDVQTFEKMGHTEEKVKTFLDEMKRTLGSSFDHDLGRELRDKNPYYGRNYWKKEWALSPKSEGWELFYFWIGFWLHDHEGVRRLCFATQLCIEKDEFYRYLEERCGKQLDKAKTKVRGCKFDKDYYWTVCQDFSQTLEGHKDIEEQAKAASFIAKKSLQEFDRAFIPLFRRAARNWKP